MLIAAAILAIIIVSLQFYNHREMVNKEKLSIHANSVASQISVVVAEASELTTHLSESQEVRDLAAMASVEEIEAWAVRVRKLFPGMVGLSISNTTGEIIGEKQKQRIGPLCERDLNVFVRGGKTSYPPVHRADPKLEHFDTLKRIRDDEGEEIGLLLVSYRLPLIQEVVDRLAKTNYYYQILLGGQDVLIERGKHGLPYTVRLTIPDTDWTLLVSSDPGTDDNQN